MHASVADDYRRLLCSAVDPGWTWRQVRPNMEEGDIDIDVPNCVCCVHLWYRPNDIIAFSPKFEAYQTRRGSDLDILQHSGLDPKFCDGSMLLLVSTHAIYRWGSRLCWTCVRRTAVTNHHDKASYTPHSFVPKCRCACSDRMNVHRNTENPPTTHSTNTQRRRTTGRNPVQAQTMTILILTKTDIQDRQTRVERR